MLHVFNECINDHVQYEKLTNNGSRTSLPLFVLSYLILTPPAVYHIYISKMHTHHKHRPDLFQLIAPLPLDDSVFLHAL